MPDEQNEDSSDTHFKGIIESDLERANIELSILDKKREKLQWKIDVLRGLLDNAIDNLIDHPRIPPHIRPIPNTAYYGMSALDAICAILKRQGEPMRTAEITDIALAGGYGGPGATKEKVMPNFSSTISRSINEDPNNSPFVRGNPRTLLGLKEWGQSLG